MIRGSRWCGAALGCALVMLGAATVAAGDPPPVLREVAKLVPAGDALEIELGYSVAIQGDTVFGGAPMGYYLNENSEGSTFVFRRNSRDDWAQTARLRVLDGKKDHFGYAVGVSGETLVVSSRYPPSAAWIFERDPQGDWVQAAHYAPQDVGGYGWSSAVWGDTVVVGSPHDSYYTGLVFVYERADGEWREVQRLHASDAEAETYFGWALALEGDTLLVGSPDNDCDGGGPPACGALYVFQRDGPGAPWSEVAKLRASDPSLGAHFGRSVALSGDLAVVGAPEAEVLGKPAGAAYLFERDPSGVGRWTEISKLAGTTVTSGDDFGYAVAVDDGLVVVGEPGDDAQRLRSGAAHLFERDPGALGGAREVAILLPSDGGFYDEFAWSVGISGDTVVSGAHWQDEVDRNAGAIYVFDAEPCRLELRVEPGEVRAGEELSVEVALRHNRFRSVIVPFLLWVEDPAGSFVAGTATRPITFRYGDTVRRRLELRIPEGTPSGVYSVLIGIERMKRGVAGAQREVRVVD